MKINSILKGIWNLLPIAFFINLLARLLIVSGILSYLGSIGNVSFIIPIILNLWALMPLYYLIRSTYFDLMGYQTHSTLLLNSLERSISDLNKASENRIISTKQRIWVERNPEINIFNYWILKHLRKDEWMNLNIEEDDKGRKNA
ncbi:hypothetical protein LCGC14_1542590 [marine sediment metagenome]|uniref:Uncharacterized protein n=1 Tax=marine sediment metagenome TaxID=412755 RepID=A0A0F9JDL6_9ZZZZ